MKNNISMRLIAFIAIITLSSFAFSYDGEKSKNSKASMFTGIETAAAQTVLAFHKALKSGDLKTVHNLLANDVLIFEGQGVERSAKEYESHHLLSDIKFLKAMQIDLIEQHVTQYDGIATSYSRSKMKGTYKGKKIDMVSNESITLALIEGQWKISHIHWSN